jgi:hypothetical protein
MALIAGLDWGLQQVEKGSSGFHQWLAPICILRYEWSERWAMGLRAEYYQDRHNVIISTPAGLRFQTSGFSLNLDRQVVRDTFKMGSKNVLWRVEARLFHNPDPIFRRENSLVRHNFFIATGITAHFE